MVLEFLIIFSRIAHKNLLMLLYSLKIIRITDFNRKINDKIMGKLEQIYKNIVT